MSARPLSLIQIDATGFRDAAGRFARAEEQLVAQRQAMMTEAMRMLLRALRANAPRSNKSGVHFADTLGYRVTETAGGTTGVIAAGPAKSWLLMMILFGTRPHPIYPQEGQALSFQWEGHGPQRENDPLGQHAYAHVNHPGTQPNPFHARTWAEVGPAVERQARRAARLAFTGLLQGV